MVWPGTTEAINGMIPSQARTPPATSTPAMRGPMMYPTPMYSGVMSANTVAAGKMRLTLLVTYRGVSAMTWKIFCNIA